MDLLILGAGSHGHVVKETAEATGQYGRICFLDNHSNKAIGRLDDYRRFLHIYQAAFVAIGDNQLRHEWFDKLQSAGFELTTLVHPRAYVSSNAVIGAGTIVEPMACINAGCVIGSGCIISISTAIDHECKIGDFAHIDCGVILLPRSCVNSYIKIANKA